MASEKPQFEVHRLSKEAFVAGVQRMISTRVDRVDFPPATSSSSLSERPKFPTIRPVSSLSAASPPARPARPADLDDASIMSQDDAGELRSLFRVVPAEDCLEGHGSFLASAPDRDHSTPSYPKRTPSCQLEVDERGDVWSLNQYNVVATLGQGSSGTVYLVEGTACGISDDSASEYVLKAIPRSKVLTAPDCAGVANEVAMMQLISGHRHIVTLHEVIDDPDQDMLFLVMDYVPGGAIATVDAGTGKSSTTLDATELRAFVTQQAEALTYVHSKGMVHGDYKVENVLFTGARGAGLQTKLADFGVAVLQSDAAASNRSFTASLTRSPVRARAFVGTPYTRAPELFEDGSASPAADAWAFGVVLHTLVTGRIPFAANTLAGLSAAVAAGLPETPAATDPPLAREWWGALSRLLCPTSPEVRVAELMELAPTGRSLTPRLASIGTCGISRRRGAVILPSTPLAGSACPIGRAE